MISKSKSLKKSSALFFQVGLIGALFFTIVAFEWKFYDGGAEVDSNRITEDMEELMDIPVTNQPPPPPPKIQQPVILEVPDEEEIEEEIEIELDIEIEEEKVIEQIIIADNEIEEESSDQIFTIVENKATYKGGEQAFYRYIANNLKYPEVARRMGVEGRVYVSFVVEKDGSLSNVKAIKGIGAGCDEEAVRIIKKSPTWYAAKQRGNPVRSQVIIPLIFNLN